MKISVIGGGSAYTPGLAEGLIAIHKEVPFTELCLMDIDEPKLEIVGKIVKKVVAETLPDVKVTTTTQRLEAIRGSAYVLCQIRVGGLSGRVLDEQIPLKHQVIGQETVGAGGIAMALRTIPVMLDIAADVSQHASDAWIINYSNPSGMVAAALARHSEVRSVSICDVPIGIQEFVGRAIGAPRKKVKLDYVGLNHLGWFRKIYVDGRNIMPMIRSMASTSNIASMLPSDDEKTAEEIEMAVRIFKQTGIIPSPYLQYYYLSRECLEKQLAADKTRGQVVQEIERELLEHFEQVAEDDAAKLWKSRGGQWHSELMVSIISAIHNDKGEEFAVNVINNGCVPGMPEDACVEVPCIVDSRGPRPLRVNRPEPDMLGLMQIVSACENLTVEAAVEGSYDKALRALNLNPLVPSLEVARQILDEYCAAHGNYMTLS